MCIAKFLEWTQFSGLLYTVPYCLLLLCLFLILHFSFCSGHDAIVTLLKHHKRPQDESACGDYSHPGGGRYSLKHSALKDIYQVLFFSALPHQCTTYNNCITLVIWNEKLNIQQQLKNNIILEVLFVLIVYSSKVQLVFISFHNAAFHAAGNHQICH